MKRIRAMVAASAIQLQTTAAGGWCAFGVCAFVAVARLSPAELAIVPAGEVPAFAFTAESVRGLSGLTWCRDDLYYAVSDRSKAIWPLRLAIDPASGALSAARLEPPIPVESSFGDFEDIACDREAGKVFISAEQPPTIAGFTLGGNPLMRVKLPPVFLTARPNLSLEAVTRDAATGRTWIANEDTLPADGEVSSAGAGGLVRLQEFDAAWKPRRQVAWRTEPSGMRVSGSGSGVAGLCLLSDGRLLVLERVLAGFFMEVRISLADLSGATDTSRLPALAGAAVVPAQKRLLFKRVSGLTNFEGIAAGPRLTDGSRSLVLVADSGNGAVHSFLALRVIDQPPPASPSAPPRAKGRGQSRSK